MGYLDNSSITVDAILTKRGRELLSRNDGSFKITQFALGDDEIDYSLFNESHPNGTQYSAEAIENMPLIEAIPNGANSMNSKLITLNRGANSIPYIQTSYANGATAIRGQSVIIDPTTHNLNSGGTASSEDYIFTILDSRLRLTFAATGGSNVISAAAVEEFSTIATSESVRGKILTMVATDSTALFSSTVTARTTSIIIEGVTSGAIVTVPLTVNYS
tara:strand:+ start:8379 stop:9032 length:654 start_codon:yes stop_codon:yes gene_type:complete